MKFTKPEIIRNRVLNDPASLFASLVDWKVEITLVIQVFKGFLHSNIINYIISCFTFITTPGRRITSITGVRFRRRRNTPARSIIARSEERRVGKESRSSGALYT